MPQNYFITGMPKTGKTTLLKKLAGQLKKMDISTGGFFTPEEKSFGGRSGFAVEDLATGKRAVLAATGTRGPKVAKYHVDIKGFESIALPVLRQAQKYDIVIIDEIGKMEMKSARFAKELERLLSGGKPVIASVHKEFMEQYCGHGEVMMLTESNRESVYTDLLLKAEDMLKSGGAEAEQQVKKEKKKPNNEGKKEAEREKQKKADAQTKKTKTTKPEDKKPETWNRKQETEEYEGEDYSQKYRKRSRLQILYDELIGF